MSLAAGRGSSRALALCLLLVSLWGLPHRVQTDDACAPLPAEAHDESKHVFTAPGAPGQHEHCAVCHWLRSVKPHLTVTGAAAVPPQLDGAPGGMTTLSRRDPATDHLPARAPPLVLP